MIGFEYIAFKFKNKKDLNMEKYSIYNAIFDILRIFAFVVITIIAASFQFSTIEYIGLIGGSLLILKDIFISIVKDMANE